MELHFLYQSTEKRKNVNSYTSTIILFSIFYFLYFFIFCDFSNGSSTTVGYR
jgi:preprotein translocase subunit SecE